MGYERFIFWLSKASPQQQVDMHAKLSYNMHLCLLYLLNNSQTIHFSNPPPLRDAALHWLVDFI